MNTEGTITAERAKAEGYRPITHAFFENEQQLMESALKSLKGVDVARVAVLAWNPHFEMRGKQTGVELWRK